MLESIFRELILDHYRTPRNKGGLEDATVSVAMKNPLCGDEITVHLGIEADRVEAVRFEGQGCSISQAATSMMTQRVTGKSLDEAIELERKFIALMHDDDAAKEDRTLGDLRALQGVAKLPVRIKCALLGWNALDEAIKAYRKSPPGAMGATLEFEDLTDLPEGYDPEEHKDDLP